MPPRAGRARAAQFPPCSAADFSGPARTPRGLPRNALIRPAHPRPSWESCQFTALAEALRAHQYARRSGHISLRQSLADLSRKLHAPPFLRPVLGCGPSCPSCPKSGKTINDDRRDRCRRGRSHGHQRSRDRGAGAAAPRRRRRTAAGRPPSARTTRARSATPPLSSSTTMPMHSKKEAATPRWDTRSTTSKN